MKNSAGLFSLLAGAVLLLPVHGLAACPDVLVDQLVSGTAWNSPSQSALGISLDSSYRMLGDEYVLSAVDPRNLQPLMLYRYAGDDHTQIGSAVTANTSTVTQYNWTVDAVASYLDDANVWGVVWQGESVSYSNMYAWLRRFNSSLVASVAEDTILDDTTFNWQFKLVVDALPSNGYYVMAVIANHPISGYDRPYIRIVRQSGTEYLGTTIVDSAVGWNAMNVSVDAFNSPNYGTLFVVAWTEQNASTDATRIRFVVYNANGSIKSSARTIYPASGRDVMDIRVAGVGNRFIVVWDSTLPTNRYDSDSYMQAWPVVGSSGLFTARKVDPNAYYDTYMPDVSADTWLATNNTTYDVYSVTYSTLTAGCSASSGYCLYPTIHLFKGTSSPVDTTGPQYLSWYPQSYMETYSDGVRTEVFTGCPDQVVIAGVDYADSDVNPSTQRGLRRTFISVTGSGVMSASMTAGASLDSADAGLVDLADPNFALENGGQIESPLLLTDELVDLY